MLWTAHGFSAQEEPDVLVFARQVPSTLDPRQAYDELINAYIWHVFEPLVDEQGGAVLSRTRLASKDSQTWDIALKSDVRFSNGEPLNADAVVYTIASIQDVRKRFNLRELDALPDWRFSRVDTLRISARTPTSPAFASLLARIAIVPLGAGNTPGFGRNPVGTGQYVVSQFDPGVRIRLVRHPSYKPRPRTNPIVIEAVPNETARREALSAGKVHIIEVSEIGPLLAMRGISIHSAAVPNLVYLRFANNRAVVKDVRVRQAIAYGLNIGELLRTELRGLGTPASSLFFPEALGYKARAFKYAYDPTNARRLLSESPDFRPGMSFALGVSPAVPRAEAMARFFGNQLRDLGFTPEIIVESLRTMIFSLAIAKVDAYVDVTPNPGLDPLIALQPLAATWHSNFVYARFSEFPTTYETAAITRRGADAFLKEYEGTVATDLPIVPLFWQVRTWASRRTVQGLAFRYDGTLLFANVTVQK